MTHSCRLVSLVRFAGSNFCPLRHSTLFSKAVIQSAGNSVGDSGRQDFCQHEAQLECEQSGEVGILGGSIPDWG